MMTDREAFKLVQDESRFRSEAYYDYLKAGGRGDCGEEAWLDALECAADSLHHSIEFGWRTDVPPAYPGGYIYVYYTLYECECGEEERDYALVFLSHWDENNEPVWCYAWGDGKTEVNWDNVVAWKYLEIYE